MTGLSQAANSNGSLTNSSAALPVSCCGGAFAGDGILFCGRTFSSAVLEASRNGFRDAGLGGGSFGDMWPGEFGDAVRLRKGLFEERLRAEPLAAAPSLRCCVNDILSCE